jgi:aerobic carbon-monoxide dehydrogenase medium subunit
MLLREVEYARPATVGEALELLAAHDDARVLAGGQTLVNVMKLRAVSPDRVVDVMRIPELRGVRVLDDGSLAIGAATTYAELTEADNVAAARPLIAEVAGMIADVQVRNRGTIGGNACLNLPTNHFPPVLVAVEAELTIAGRDGERVVAASEFFEGPFATAVRHGELLTSIRVPPRRVGQGEAFVAMSAGKESQSVVHVAASLQVNGRIEEAHVVLGCVAPRPLRAAEVERQLVGSVPDAARVAAAVRGLGATLAPQADVNASAEFKRHVAEVLAQRAVAKGLERARVGVGG